MWRVCSLTPVTSALWDRHQQNLMQVGGWADVGLTFECATDTPLLNISHPSFPPPQLEALKEEAILLQTQNDWAVLERRSEDDSPLGFPHQSGGGGGVVGLRHG